jgi:hypothetical protein
MSDTKINKIDYKDENIYNSLNLEIIYNSLEDEEELIFFNIEERIIFNKYMMYLNYLEVNNLIKLKIYESCINKIRKIKIIKLKEGVENENESNRS